MIEDKMDKRTIHKHPSYGVIRLNKTSGTQRLFDSMISHQNYVSLEIYEAERSEDNELGYHSVNPVKQIIRVAMSESQFARAITSFHVGCGSPCTIQRLNNVSIDEPPQHDDTELVTKTRDASYAERLVNARAALQTINDMKERRKRPTIAELDKLAAAVEECVLGIEAHDQYFHDRFREILDKEKDVAKSEIEAHINLVLQQSGISHTEPITLNRV